MSSYNTALEFLYHQLPMFQRQGPKAFKKDLKNIRRLADSLGNPQTELKCIHVAGTNGKGTVSHFIAATLQAAGYRVGLYTSPHYKDFRERIKINGKFIDRKFVVQFVAWFHDQEHIDASFFEITVAMAFDYFKKEKVDYAVIETGLGGRLDSTNIVEPILSVITNISLDHTNFLGNTLELIAGEKAGIIKNNIPILIGRKQIETTSVFQTKAKGAKAPLFFAEDIVKDEAVFRELVVHKKAGNEKVKFLSPFIHENRRTAIAALAVLKQYYKLNIKDSQVDFAIKNVHELTYFIGRWMHLGSEPMIIADSAHNEDGLQSSLLAIGKIKFEQLHIVLGCVNDKDLSRILTLFPPSAAYYFAKAQIPRGLDANELRKRAAQYSLMGKAYTSIRRAFAAAKRRAGPADLIYVGGSIFTVAEIV